MWSGVHILLIMLRSESPHDLLHGWSPRLSTSLLPADHQPRRPAVGGLHCTKPGFSGRVYYFLPQKSSHAGASAHYAAQDLPQAAARLWERGCMCRSGLVGLALAHWRSMALGCGFLMACLCSPEETLNSNGTRLCSTVRGMDRECMHEHMHAATTLRATLPRAGQPPGSVSWLSGAVWRPC